MDKDKINSLKEAMKLNNQSLFSQRDSIKSAIESLNGSTLKQAMALQTSGYLSTLERMKKEMSSFMKPHGLGSVLAEQESLKANMLGVGYMSEIERMKKEMSSRIALEHIKASSSQTNSIKQAIDSLKKTYGLGSVLAQQASLFSMIGTEHMSAVERMKKEMSSGLGSVLAQQASLSSMIGAGHMSEIERIKKEMSSLMKPYGLESVLEQAKAFSEVTISNTNIIKKFQNLDISELILLHNDLSHTLKPYDIDYEITKSHISWIDLKELLNYLAAIITIYMYWIYLSTTPLEKKDVEKMFIKQQFQMQEEFKKQNKHISNLVKLKNKDLYYLTVRDNIVLRTNPYIKKSTAKARLDKDIELLVLLRKDNWLNVEYFDEENQITQVGWVHIKNLKRVRKY